MFILQMYALQTKYVHSTQLAAGDPLVCSEQQQALKPVLSSLERVVIFSYQSSHLAIAWLQSQQRWQKLLYVSLASLILQACLVFPCHK